MQRDKRTTALVTQQKKLFAQFEAFVDQTPQSRYRDFFKRQGHKCLMSLQNCQRSPLRAPGLAAFSRSLKAIAANTGDLDLFGKLFHVIYTTLRDADKSPTPQTASVLAAQCNEILSQHKHLLSPLVIEILKVQGEAAYKCVTESVTERSVSISDGWLPQLVESVSNLVHKWWGADVDEQGLPAKQGPVTASEIIASVNPALAGTIGYFLKFIQAVLVDVPLGPQQLSALQRLLQTELHIVGHLKKTGEDATKSEMERYIKQEFISHVDSLWPFIINYSNADISKALNKKYTDTFKTLTQTSVLSSLIQRVTKLTCDRRVQALTSFVMMLNSSVRGVGGFTCWAEIESGWDKVGFACEARVDQTLWETVICPVLFPNGSNSLNFWRYQYLPSTPMDVYTCTSIGSLTDQILRPVDQRFSVKGRHLAPYSG
eukprot:Blabericola_migrator_1__5733@NODE_2907_length_2216_cov_5_424383_g1826_i0_p1_GENE_NODE_2907_length_2216_cov_5_424383_g1826_i0NODE_2907_length_2216_cov_5_424383_g1826_i0_p1_ORF_typecomplete_len430_score51_06GIIM/PF08388_11/3_1GIIM/PF08388_11/2_9e02Pkip1/PF06878_11/8_4e03Pkip1/PF06878_11/0_24NADH_dehy_S2_C/PF06444_11/6_1e03NADH_dehy_S2_C/PF06444_11/0_57DUF4294/PF14127_6/4_4e03DUF4294/PF14127_6/1_9e03DUF4294/PF14127_6/0_47_NODE_2907_length_2216_cov_5_424383_g1826_i07172006